MAGSPKWKVYDADGTYQAACKDIVAAAALVGSFYCEGSTIRLGHPKKRTVWTEGVDGFASDSYDIVCEVVNRRMFTH